MIALLKFDSEHSFIGTILILHGLTSGNAFQGSPTAGFNNMQI